MRQLLPQSPQPFAHELVIVAIIIYVLLAAEFLIRYFVDKPVRKGGAQWRGEVDRGVRLMIIGLCISSVFLFIRCAQAALRLAPLPGSCSMT